MRWLGWLAILVMPLAAVAATEGDAEKMRLHYQRAMEAVSRGDHRTAIGEFDEAYAAVPKPNILYNVAREYEAIGLSGDIAAKKLAIDYYRRYLAERKDAPDRDQVGLFIGELESGIAKAQSSSVTSASHGHPRVNRRLLYRPRRPTAAISVAAESSFPQQASPPWRQGLLSSCREHR